MKDFLKRVASMLVTNETSWKIVDRLLVGARFLEIERCNYFANNPKPILSDEVKLVAPDLVVKYGTFKGMKYPNKDTIAYGFIPRFLGVYEHEIQPLVERICQKKYEQIIDVGCAEGYYAVGLGMRTGALVYAYDTNELMLKECKEMAKINNVRLVPGSFCSPETLLGLNLTKALVLSDCEGYEKELFNKETVSFLRNHDVLIEVHDFIDITISQYLLNLFKDSHNVEIIDSVDDIRKAQTLNFKELEQFSLPKRRILLGSYRPNQQQWFFFTPKN